MWGGSIESVDEPATSIKVVTSPIVQINGKKVFVPLSSYSDLANPRRAGISTKGDTFLISITGGVDAPSYTAEILFTGEGIKSKTVTSTADPKEVWEMTYYSLGGSD
jgi:hypothetical protein